MMRFFKYLCRVRRLSKQNKREDERFYSVHEAKHLLADYASPEEIILVARHAIICKAADCDIGAPKANSAEHKKLKAVYDVLTNVLAIIGEEGAAD